MSKSILIVEDEPLIADDLKIVIEKLGYTVAAMVDSAEGAVDFLLSNKVDLALLDVQIKGDTDGIDLAGILKEKFGVPYIFLTSFFDDDTIYRIREASPLAYIVKPYKDIDIKVNLGLAFNRKNDLPTQSSSAEIENHFVRKNGEMVRLNIDDVLWIKGEDNYSDIYMTNGEKYTISQTLKSMEDKFPLAQFVRIQKGYIIKLSAISSISGNTVYIGKESIPIGKAYRKDFFKKLMIL
ncbi:MAG: LytTR family transcriptional regulator DNA-binding domain-containing protein [Flavobacteriales bacterium]|nr:LytTR family transcriptional regulator DNA-binding domain-containing protein [Flavobacteriales bacterium]